MAAFNVADMILSDDRRKPVEYCIVQRIFIQDVAISLEMS